MTPARGRPWTEQDAATVVAQHNAGIDHAEIGRLLDRTKEAIDKQVWKHCGAQHIKRWAPETDARLLKMFAKGRTSAEIGEALGCTASVAKRRRRRLNELAKRAATAVETKRDRLSENLSATGRPEITRSVEWHASALLRATGGRTFDEFAKLAQRMAA